MVPPDPLPVGLAPLRCAPPRPPQAGYAGLDLARLLRSRNKQEPKGYALAPVGAHPSRYARVIQPVCYADAEDRTKKDFKRAIALAPPGASPTLAKREL
jgi:hypothetical protein